MAFVITAVTAVEAAIAIGTISSIATAVATVGAAMTVVGTVTKSKELIGAGKVLSIAGGVTSLVNSGITALTSNAVAEGVAGAATGAVADTAADSLVTGASDALSGTAASTGSSGIIDAAQNMGKFDLTSANFGVDTSLMNGVSEALPTTGATDFAGAVKAATPSLGSTAGQTIDDYVANLGPQGISTPAGVVGAESSMVDKMKSKFGAAWDSFSPTTKADLLKSALAIPGAIQKQKNDERLLDMQQLKISQTSHGSEVPVFGIIQRAQKAGGA